MEKKSKERRRERDTGTKKREEKEYGKMQGMERRKKEGERNGIEFGSGR